MTTEHNTLQDLARALDQAISSNSPAVRKQFEQLMVLLALTQTTEDARRLPGPFEQMIQNVESLARRCEQLEQRITQMEFNKNTYQNPFNPGPSNPLSPGQPIWTTTPLSPSPTTTPWYTTGPIGNVVGQSSDTITLTGAAGMSYDTISLSDYTYTDNTMSGTYQVGEQMSSEELDKLIKDLSITINKEKKNA